MTDLAPINRAIENHLLKQVMRGRGPGTPGAPDAAVAVSA